MGWYIVIGVFAVDFAGPNHSAKLASLLDILGYAAATTFDFVGGELIDKVGWELFFGVLTIGSIMSLVCQVPFQILEARSKTDRKWQI